MNAREISLVRTSFADVLPRAEALSDNLYQRLFRRTPDLRAIFPETMVAQRRKLIETLAAVVDALDRPADLKPMVEALAIRHVGYAAEPAHYALVGDALVAALRDALGPRFPPDTDDAWRKAYAMLSDTMIAAAARHGTGTGDQPPA